MFPILPMVMSTKAKEVGNEVYEKRQNLKFQMGITGAPFGRTGLLIPPLESQERALARGEGPRVPGGWGVGKKLKNVSCLGHLFLIFFF